MRVQPAAARDRLEHGASREAAVRLDPREREPDLLEPAEEADRDIPVASELARDRGGSDHAPGRGQDVRPRPRPRRGGARRNPRDRLRERIGHEHRICPVADRGPTVGCDQPEVDHGPGREARERERDDLRGAARRELLRGRAVDVTTGRAPLEVIGGGQALRVDDTEQGRAARGDPAGRAGDGARGRAAGGLERPVGADAWCRTGWSRPTDSGRSFPGRARWRSGERSVPALPLRRHAARHWSRRPWSGPTGSSTSCWRRSG